MVITRISLNRNGSPFGGNTPSRRRNTINGAMVKASRPMMIAPRFLPSTFPAIGAITTAMIAEM